MIPNGYKETEIGVIPLDWEVVKLGSLVNIISGQSPSNFDLTGSTYKFFKVNQLNFCEKYLTNSEYAFDKEIENLLECGTIIFPKRGASIFTNKVRILTHKSFIDTNLMGLIVNSDLNNMFLYYLLIKFELSNIADTSSIPQINNKHIVPLKIPLPPLKQQQKIAKILSTTDNKIEAITKQIEKAEMVKKGLMQRLFDKGEEEILDNICSKIIGGGTPNTKIDAYWKNGTIPWATVKDMDNRKYLDSTQDFITQEGLGNSSANLIPANSIITATRMGVGRFFINSIDMAINQDLKALIIKEKYDKNFIFWSLVSKSKLLESMGTGTTVKGIRLEEFKKIQFNIPPLKQQQKIANILTKSDQKIEILKAKKEQYQALKKGLMQKLLTGEIGV